jgi:3-isopropylmalate/(R)-2-methylmalate dehydratase large subunit
MGHDNSFLSAYEVLRENGIDQVADPDKVVVIMDHRIPATTVVHAEGHRKTREYVQIQGIKNFYDAGTGICHTVLPEKGHALPGRLIVGGDSHTTTYGALGVASTGIGISELAYVLCKGSLWFMVPETIKFVLTGTLGKGVSSKDVILNVARQFTVEVAQYKAVEFTGPVAHALEVDERMTKAEPIRR